MQTLLQFIDRNIKVYTRPGTDWGIDAISGDGLTVYQAKYHEQNNINKIISDSRDELEKIKKYKSEKEYWKDVKNWVLFTNININPAYEEKWTEQIKDKFHLEGIDAVLWHWGIIKKHLTEHPTVYNAFFKGEPRIFYTFSDEIQRQKEENWFPLALEVNCVGRDDAFRKLENFLISGEKVWAIAGPGGMGKTRFLLECAKRVTSDWTIYWSTREHLKHPSLYDIIVPERKTLLLVDELEDENVITFLLKELISGRMQQWKLIFTERVGDAATIKFLEEKKYGNLCFPTYHLRPLNKPDRENLIRELINKTGLSFSDSVENIAASLGRISDGIPLWIGLCIRLISEDGGLQNLPEQSERLLKKYMEFSINSLATGEISKTKFYQLLQWIALYGKINTQDKDMLSFLSVRCAIRKKQVLDIFQLLVDKGIAFRKGAEKRYIEIAPDSLREQILIDALIDVDQTTDFAKEIINILLEQKEKAPAAAQILENIARVEVIQNLITGKKVDLLFPILSQLQDITQNGSTLDQISVIELVKHFEYARPLEVVHILKTCWEKDNGEIKHKDDFWGENIFNHEYVKSKIAWALFRVARYADNMDIQKEVYCLFLKIMEEEIKTSKEYSEISESAKSLFYRMLFGEDWSNKYRELCIKKINMLFDKLEKGEKLSQLEKHIFYELIKGLTTAEKMVNETTFDDRITMMIIHIIPGVEECAKEWNLIQTYKKRLQHLLIITTVDEDVLVKAAELYANIISSVNRAIAARDKNEESVKLANQFFIDELNWIKSFLQKTIISIALTVRKKLRNVWQWHLKFSGNADLKSLAIECEKTFYFNEEHKELAEFFDDNFRKIEERDLIFNRIFEKYFKDKDQQAVFDFLKKTTELFPNENKDLVYKLGYSFGESLNEELMFEKLCKNLLSYNHDSFYWEFGIGMIKSYLKILRKSNVSKAQEQIKRCLPLVSNIEQFLWQYYRLPWYEIGPINSEDIKIIVDNIFLFSEPYHKWKLFADLTYCSWTEITIIIDKCWDNLLEDDKKTYLDAVIADSMHIEDIKKYNNFEWGKEKFEWLIEKLALLVELDWLENRKHNLERTLHLKGLKSITWLLDIIRKRKKVMKEIKVLPYHFHLTFFVTPVLPNEKKKKAFDKLIELSTKKNLFGDYLADYLKDLDAEGIFLGTLVSKKILEATDENRIYRLARIANRFENDTKVWDEISMAVCTVIKTKDEKTRENFYRALSDWQYSFSRGHGQVAAYYYEQVEKAREGLNSEKHPERLEYWKKKIEWSEKDLRKAEEEAKEERGE